MTLTFDPMTLTLYKILALIDVYPHTKFGFSPTHGIWEIDQNVRLLPTDGRTDGRTNGPTDGPTKQFIEMRPQSLDASKNSRSYLLNKELPFQANLPVS